MNWKKKIPPQTNPTRRRSIKSTPYGNSQLPATNPTRDSLPTCGHEFYNLWAKGDRLNLPPKWTCSRLSGFDYSLTTSTLTETVDNCLGYQNSTSDRLTERIVLTAFSTCGERVSTLPDIPKLNLGSFPNFLGNPQTSAVLLKNEQK